MVDVKVVGSGHYEYRLNGADPREKQGIKGLHLPHRIELFDVKTNQVAKGYVMDMGRPGKEPVNIVLAAGGGLNPSAGVLSHVTLDLPAGASPIEPVLKYNGKELDANHLPTELTTTDEVRRTVGQFNGKIGMPIVKIDGKIVDQQPAITPPTPPAKPKTVELSAGSAQNFHLAIANTTIGKQTKTDVQAFNEAGQDPHHYPLSFDKPAKLDARPQINGNTLHRDAAGHLQQDPAHPLTPNSLAALDKFTVEVPVMANANTTIIAGRVKVLTPSTGVINIQVSPSEAKAKLAELKAGHFTDGNDTKISFDPAKVSVVLVDETGKNLFARAATGKEYKYDEAGKQPAEIGVVTSSAPIAGKVEGKKGDSYQLRDSGGLLEVVTNGGGRGFEAATFIASDSPDKLSFTIQHNDTIFIDALKKPASIVFPENAKIDLNVYDKEGKKIDASAYKAVILDLNPVGKGITVIPNESLAGQSKDVEPAKASSTTPAVAGVDANISNLRKITADFRALERATDPQFITQHNAPNQDGWGDHYRALEALAQKDSWNATDIDSANLHVKKLTLQLDRLLVNPLQSPSAAALIKRIHEPGGIMSQMNDAVHAVQPSKNSSMNMDKKEPGVAPTTPPTTPAVADVDANISNLRKITADFRALERATDPQFITQHNAPNQDGWGDHYRALEALTQKDSWNATDIDSANLHVKKLTLQLDRLLVNPSQSPSAAELIKKIHEPGGIMSQMNDAVHAVQPSKNSSMNVDKKEPETLVGEAKDKKPGDLGFNPIASLNGKDAIAKAIEAAAKGLPQPVDKMPPFLADNGAAQKTDKMPQAEPIGAKKGGEIGFTA